MTPEENTTPEVTTPDTVVEENVDTTTENVDATETSTENVDATETSTEEVDEVDEAQHAIDVEANVKANGLEKEEEAPAETPAE